MNNIFSLMFSLQTQQNVKLKNEIAQNKTLNTVITIAF